MITNIRKGKSPYYGDNVFTHGISRSGYFNKRESDELLTYGYTFAGLADGSLLPINEDEQLFVEQLTTVTTYYPAKLWQKYLHAVEKSKIHHGFAKSNAKSSFSQNNDLEFA
ncbi:DUF413 domain-containing protein [Thalassotalea sediminis]|uniref:DUF413 domain-containing protein n=1 Tax=Thalassotalea sediminis TaxID=1759089 RepID=UPI002574007C|nr:DUF413 domain-containing protein [Thalassotalea sediminis]